MPTQLLNDLRDPSPPIPGPAHRAAVMTRARQLSHRRRIAQMGGALAVVAVLAIGGAVVAISSDTPDSRVIAPQLASVRGSTTTPPLRTLVVTFTGEDGTYEVNADPDGTFELEGLPAGQYKVKWAYEQEGIDPSDAQIGSAVSVGRMTIMLSSGLNPVIIPL